MAAKTLSTIFLYLILSLSSAHAQVMHFKNKPNSTVLFAGNRIRFSAGTDKSILGRTLRTNPTPVALNNERIYSTATEGLIQPVYQGPEKQLSTYIFTHMKKYFQKLEDGTYFMNTQNLCIDQTGKLIYFDFAEIIRLSNDIQPVSDQAPAGISIKASGKGKADVPVSLKKELNNALYSILKNDAIRYTPGMLKSGEKVNCYLAKEYNFNDFIVVKNHVATLQSWKAPERE